MFTKAIDFYDDFKCLKDKCPYTCCEGWSVAVDDETYENHRKEKGIRSLKLKLLLKSNKDKIHIFKNIKNKCAYCTREGLCSFQSENRMDLVPKVCKAYPGRCISYGEITEITLELSCYKAALLFVKNPMRHQFVESNASSPIVWKLNNDDEKYCKLLMKASEEILDFWWKDDLMLPEKMQHIYEFTYVIQETLVTKGRDAANNITIPLSNELKAKICIKHSPGKCAGYAFFSMELVDHLIFKWMANRSINNSSKFIREMVACYEASFGQLEINKADTIFCEKVERMFVNDGNLKTLFQSYFAYLLQQTFCQAYEDYYIIKPMLLALLHTQILLVLFVAKTEESGTLSDEQKAALICNVEKTIRHNESFDDYFMEQLWRENR